MRLRNGTTLSEIIAPLSFADLVPALQRLRDNQLRRQTPSLGLLRPQLLITFFEFTVWCSVVTWSLQLWQ